MKSIILLSMLVFSVSAGANDFHAEGKKSQDYFVKIIRSNFSSALTPTESDLKLNEAWSCRLFNAMEDRFDISQVSVTFKKIGNNKYYGIGVGCPVLRIYEDEGVTGDYRNQYAGNFYSCTGRVLNSGDMIIETSKSDTEGL